jgi:hypothetical protein
MLRFMHTHKSKKRARWNLCLAEGTSLYVKFGIHYTAGWPLFIARSNTVARGLTYNIFKFVFLHHVWSQLLTAPLVKQVSKIKRICLFGYVAMLYQLLQLCSPMRCKIESGRTCKDVRVNLAYFKLLRIISSGEVGDEKYYMNRRLHFEDVSFS